MASGSTASPDPDEYTAIVDNNVFTNVMAARNMAVAADLAVRHPARADELGVDDEEIASWRDAAAAIVVPYDRDAQITQQCNGFTRLRKWDFADTPPDQYPLLLHHHNYMLYSSQVIKQADLVFAIYLCGNRWTEDQKARDFAYYESVTVRDSSLSAPIQAVVAAEVGHLELAFDYLTETAFIDLRDLAFNTRDGVHLASLSGVWHAIVGGFGGMRDSRQDAGVRPPPPVAADPPALRAAVPWPPAPRRRPARRGDVRAARREAPRDPAPRRADHGRAGRPDATPDPAGASVPDPSPTLRTGAGVRARRGSPAPPGAARGRGAPAASRRAEPVSATQP